MRRSMFSLLLTALFIGLVNGPSEARERVRDQVKATRADLDRGDNPQALIEETLRRAGFIPQSPRAQGGAGDLLLASNAALFLEGADCWSALRVREGALIVPGYRKTDSVGASLGVKEITGRLADLSATAGSEVAVTAKLSGLRVEQVALGTLEPTAACRTALGRAGGPLEVLSAVVVAEKLEVMVSARQGASAKAKLRPALAELVGEAHQLHETELGYAVDGPLVVAVQKNEVSLDRATVQR